MINELIEFISFQGHKNIILFANVLAMVALIAVMFRPKLKGEAAWNIWFLSILQALVWGILVAIPVQAKPWQGALEQQKHLVQMLKEQSQ
jgi:hypothetical protein